MMVTSPFILWVAAGIVFFVRRQGLYEQQSGSKVRYAVPTQFSISGLLFAASFLWAIAYTPSASYWPIDVMFVLPSLALVCLLGPREVRIDLEKRTYRFTSGWAVLRKQRDGPLEDISRLRMERIRGTCYTLVLDWKSLKRWDGRPFSLGIGQFTSRAEAEAAADHVLQLLDINVPVGDPGPDSYQQWRRRA